MSSLLSLPVEILNRICEYAGDHRFSCLSIIIQRSSGALTISPTALNDKAKHWTEILQNNAAFPAVRELSLIEEYPSINEVTSGNYPDYKEAADELTPTDQRYRPLIARLFDCKTHRGYALATSLNLTSILVPASQYDTNGCVEYNAEAVRAMAAGLAPNLRAVYVMHGALQASLEYAHAVQRGRPPWRGFFPSNLDVEAVGPVPGARPVRLQTWSLSPAKMQYFAPSEGMLDFSTLETLHLWDIEAGVLMLLCRRHRHNHTFTRLQSLALHLEYPEDRDTEEYSPAKALRLDETASSFLSILDKAFQTLLTNHGPSLHTLSLVSPAGAGYAETGAWITIDRLHQIQTRCPNLRALRIPLLRSRGDANEMGIYNALGNLGFSRLTDLVLLFHLTDGTSGSFDAASGPSRRMLINAAMDHPLAREIFTYIVNAGARSLQTLKITYADGALPYKLAGIAGVMARQWECTRRAALVLGNASSDFDIDMMEIGIKARRLRESGRVRPGMWKRVFREL
ncbi:hypothetical protein BDW74DRAFT_179557 [Aspergillus multicolor]|uniref:uncharacterized protein n=1 Tax=Aspergillus multicolor TaxID=41759 RepID=UPI003CCDF6E4